MNFAVLVLLTLALQASSEDAADGNLRGVPEPSLETEDRDASNVLETPDVSGPIDHPGPYDEEPSEVDASKPQNATLSNLQEAEFCSIHRTGFWCNATTRVRCCKLKDGSFVKCGSAVNSTACGLLSPDTAILQNTTLGAFSTWWPPYWGPSPPSGGEDRRRDSDRRRDDDRRRDSDRRRRDDRRRDDRRRDDRRRDDRRRDDRRREGDRRRDGGWGGGWTIHPGWHVSTFCETHHVGQFCSSHRIIHCCNDYGHWVECNSQYDHGSWYC